MKDILISLYEKILAIKEVIPVKEWNDLLDALRLPEPEIKEGDWVFCCCRRELT